jgi:hypothetical protein
MTRFDDNRFVRAVAVFWLLAATLSVVPPGRAIAEDNATIGAGAAPQAPETPAASAPAQPAPAEKRGLMNDIRRWWDHSFADFDAKMKAAKDKLDDFNKKQNDAAKDAGTATQEALKNAAQATKDAATAVVRLPNTRVLELLDRCDVAANGAPDCRAAAINACRKKGFNSGQPIDVRTSQECPAAVALSGRTPVEGECPDETVVLRAVCQ